MLFCVRVPVWVLGYPVGPTSHPGPAVHSEYGRTALHWAAFYGNRRIVRSLVASGADVNAQDHDGCAVSACGKNRPHWPSLRRRLPCRYTPLHYAADNGASDGVAELLLRGADGAVQDCNAALRHTAEPKPHNRARAGVSLGRRRSNTRNPRGSLRNTRRGRVSCTPPAPSRAVNARRRRSPIQRAGGRPPTVTDALAAPRRALWRPRVGV
jgi:hypothetical protein